jgi:hypothetical protein
VDIEGGRMKTLTIGVQENGWRVDKQFRSIASAIWFLIRHYGLTLFDLEQKMRKEFQVLKKD